MEVKDKNYGDQVMSIVVNFLKVTHENIYRVITAFSKQSYKNFELIFVVPDIYTSIASKLAIKYSRILKLNIRIIKKSVHTSLSGGRNIGIQHSKVKYISFIDNDAIPVRNWVKIAIKKLKKANAITGPVIPIFKRDKCYRTIPKSIYTFIGGSDIFCPTHETEVCRLYGGNMAFRYETFKKIGMFNDKYGMRPADLWHFGDDTEFAIRMCVHGLKIIWVPEYKVYHLNRECSHALLIRRAYKTGRTIKFLKIEYPKHHILPWTRFINEVSNILSDLTTHPLRPLNAFITTLSFFLGLSL